ncbi:pre-rRNA-processing protein TSR2 homolog [Rhodamnia argentea]|uniref:Pre-rRNA-processing protein TSR2 homolog n=1 Tax=Rhodamnia argentea TaxID=178133 RepID=A0A8B8PK91_9MYRT|nr:pre-rRNA-processing protein TSR2 homolog [Rhodamnia argentea]
MEPPRQLPEQAAPIFREGIALTLSRWSALQMAVDNEWGGPNSRQRADELGHEIFAWFTQSKEPLYFDDLEDLLHDAMISLNTVAEDGSVEEVAEKLLIMHEECLEGNFTAIEKLREASLKRVAPAHIKQVVEGEEEEEDSDSEDMMDDSPYMMVDAPKAQPSPTAVNKAGDEGRPPQTADSDGWTVVSSRKSRAKKL